MYTFPQAVSSNRLKNAECIRLMFPIGKMLSLIQPSQIMPHLQEILTPYITGLQEISSTQQGCDITSTGSFLSRLQLELWLSTQAPLSLMIE